MASLTSLRFASLTICGQKLRQGRIGSSVKAKSSLEVSDVGQRHSNNTATIDARRLPAPFSSFCSVCFLFLSQIRVTSVHPRPIPPPISAPSRLCVSFLYLRRLDALGRGPVLPHRAAALSRNFQNRTRFRSGFSPNLQSLFGRPHMTEIAPAIRPTTINASAHLRANIAPNISATAPILILPTLSRHPTYAVSLHRSPKTFFKLLAREQRAQVPSFATRPALNLSATPLKPLHANQAIPRTSANLQHPS